MRHVRDVAQNRHRGVDMTDNDVDPAIVVEIHQCHPARRVHDRKIGPAGFADVFEPASFVAK